MYSLIKKNPLQKIEEGIKTIFPKSRYENFRILYPTKMRPLSTLLPVHSTEFYVPTT